MDIDFNTSGSYNHLCAGAMGADHQTVWLARRNASSSSSVASPAVGSRIYGANQPGPPPTFQLYGWEIGRSVLVFDTSALAGRTILGVHLIFPNAITYGKGATLWSADTLCIVSHDGTTVGQVGGYSHYGGSALVSITSSGMPTAAPYTVDLDGTGLLNASGNTYIGFRSNYDLTGNKPTPLPSYPGPNTTGLAQCAFTGAVVLRVTVPDPVPAAPTNLTAVFVLRP